METPIKSLTKNQRLAVQNKFANYIESVRNEHRLKVGEMALKLGYTSQALSMMRNSVVPYPRLIGALEFLRNFSELNKMSASEFVAYLLGTKKREESALKKWEIRLLRCFDGVDISLKSRAIKSLEHSSPEAKKHILEIISSLKDMDNKQMELLTYVASKKVPN